MTEIFIIGTGASLNQITPEEVDYVNRAKAIISFNLYLPFWERIGIVPTHYILLDSTKALFVYEMVFRTCKNHRFGHIEFFLSKYWDGRIYRSAPEFYRQKLKRFLRGRRPPDMVLVDGSIKIGYVHFTSWNRLEYQWGKNLEERLFHFRGTLTTAINIAHILDPSAMIKLLGVDLNKPEYFFHDQIPQLLKLKEKEGRSDLDWQYNLNVGKHGTILPYKGAPPVTAAFPFILRQVRGTGGRIACCNPESLLVEEGHLAYSPVREN